VRRAAPPRSIAGFAATGTFTRDEAIAAMAEDDSLLAVVAGGTVDRVTCRRRRRGSRWTWWRRAHLGWPLPRRDRVESAGWLPLHPVVAHRGTGSVLPLIEEVVLTATLTTSPSVVHLRHVADLAPEDRVGLPTSRSADPATHPPSHLLGGSPCVRWVSVRTSSSATWAYADDRTPCGPISALSRWRHGFESVGGATRSTCSEASESLRGFSGFRPASRAVDRLMRSPSCPSDDGL
jgi:hypothetical protein